MKDSRKIRGIIIVFFVILAAIGVSGCTGGDDDDDDDSDNDLILAYSVMKYGPAQNDGGCLEAASNPDSAVCSQLIQGLN